MGSYEVDREQWAKLTICEQMGNVSAEVGRAIAAHRRGKADRSEGAVERAIDLFNATADAWLAKSPARVKEVLRARDEFLRLFYDGTFDADASNLERYFMQFAFAARNGK